MPLRTKWWIVSFGGSVAVAVALLMFPALLFDQAPPYLGFLLLVICWPVIVCEFIVDPGPSIGPPGEHMQEGTPVHILAAVFGIALSWMFWSSLVFFIKRIRAHRQNRNVAVRR
jgi:hypothetical protein